MPRITKPVDDETASKLDGLAAIVAADQVTPEVEALLDIAGTPVKRVPKSRVNVMSDVDLGDIEETRPEEFICLQVQLPEEAGEIPRLLRCYCCGKAKERMAIFENARLGLRIYLCFLGCKNFPEPFIDIEGVPYEKVRWDDWYRVDPWQDYKKELPRLRKDVRQGLREMAREHGLSHDKSAPPTRTEPGRRRRR